MAREHCNRGYATEGIRGLLAHIEQRALTLDAMVYVDNRASIRLLDRFGFSRIPPTGERAPAASTTVASSQRKPVLRVLSASELL